MNFKILKKLNHGRILKNKNDIERVLKNGIKISRNIFTVFICNSESSNVAFLISKKAGNAIKRNRMKRLFREAYRLNQENFKSKEVVFLIRNFKDDFKYIFDEIQNIR